MALTTRRQFVQQATLATAAACGHPIEALAKSPRIFEARDQNAAPVDAGAIRKLASHIIGRVITPDAPEYESARLVFNRALDRRPALIVRCAGAPDVTREQAPTGDSSGDPRQFCSVRDVPRWLWCHGRNQLPGIVIPRRLQRLA